MSSTERTGWRDEDLSLRHRKWGQDVPAIDLDFLLVEYDNATPVALIDYKHTRHKPIDLTHASYRALAKLGDATGLPVFYVVYADGFQAWSITAINYRAKEIVRHSRICHSEIEYVEFLYRLRKREMPEEITLWLRAHPFQREYVIA